MKFLISRDLQCYLQLIVEKYHYKIFKYIINPVYCILYSGFQYEDFKFAENYVGQVCVVEYNSSSPNKFDYLKGECRRDIEFVKFKLYKNGWPAT